LTLFQLPILWWILVQTERDRKRFGRVPRSRVGLPCIFAKRVPGHVLGENRSFK
jgi:hypothetical protein